ncbi:uncharacterized protein LOC130961460 isoform X2 [Arachis stenosperma]|uniref:uncharacterized protein LOC130961460 isoform X2 n=1 Tax=Arachis stenosperma TaxID=217475 RepID=UPI0025AC3657|nr:uncharacterized protein LOC130961460 isoform X2 [Arachis stenosperma]
MCCIFSHARACGGGSITESVQKFIWDHCLSTPIFLKKLISEVEFDHSYVLDYLYELYAQYMTSFKDDSFGKRDTRVCKRISHIFPDGYFELQSKQHSRVLVFTLQYSLNMLEGDTGCSILPSNLLLSELILSHPYLFSVTHTWPPCGSFSSSQVCLIELLLVIPHSYWTKQVYFFAMVSFAISSLVVYLGGLFIKLYLLSSYLIRP